MKIPSIDVLSDRAKAFPTAAKITAGVLAAALAIGIITICTYIGKTGLSSYCDVYNGSRRISSEPLKISDTKLIDNPVDRADEYEAVPLAEINSGLVDVYPTMFIDNDRVIAEGPNGLYIYNFSTDTLTPIDLSKFANGERIYFYSTPIQLQYKSPSDYWIMLESSVQNSEIKYAAVHFSGDKPNKMINYTPYLKHTDDNQYTHAANAYAKKLVEYSESGFIESGNERVIAVTDFNGNSKDILLTYYIDGRIRWLNNDWIEIPCRNKKDGYKLDYLNNSKSYKELIVRLNVNTEQTVVTKCIYEDSAEMPAQTKEEKFYTGVISDYGGALASYRFNEAGSPSLYKAAVLDTDKNCFLRFGFNNKNGGTVRGEYIYTYSFIGDAICSLYRYNVRTEKYERFAILGDCYGLEPIASPSGSRVIAASTFVDNNAADIKYYYIRQKSDE